MEVPEDLQYSRTHEWVRMADGIATVGITDHAQTELGDVVYVELPEPGVTLEVGAAFGAVESVKAVSDLYSPVAGEIAEVNTALNSHTELVNTEPYRGGWLVRVRVRPDAAPEDLLTAAEYRAFVEDVGR
jgi:glycine cleavage system H protein